MNINDTVIKYDEKVIFALRELYSRYGYSQYKMSKFEEYDLYVRNKDFLISDGVITFTDTNGRLMALKPDVTLSIIKSSRDIEGFVQKFYYNENVYRVSDRTHSYKEIMQVGLECIGDIDEYSVCEVVSLAAKSLVSIDANALLDISHLGILSAVFDYAGIAEVAKGEVMRLVGEKNSHELSILLSDLGIEPEKAELVKKIVGLYGRPAEVIEKLRNMLDTKIDTADIDLLEDVIESLDKELSDIVRIDFSVISDIKYYNGIVFKGFIGGIPQSVLSGGQYDRLMKKMQKGSGAVGFAVYLDMLERRLSDARKYDVDTVIVYSGNTDTAILKEAVEKYSECGSVCVQRSIPARYSCKRVVTITDGEVVSVEDRA